MPCGILRFKGNISCSLSILLPRAEVLFSRQDAKIAKKGHYDSGKNFAPLRDNRPERRTAIELDGEIHDIRQQRERDELRTWIINQLGIKVLRLRNEELENLPSVLEKVAKYLQ